MRRRGTPNACCSSCGKLKQKLEELWNRVSGAIVRINNISADGNNEFTIQGGDRISITPITNGIEIASSADAVGVATINSEDPDSDGNFDIVAGSGILVTPGTNEVEVKADTSVLMDLSSAQNVTGSKTFDGRVYSKTGFVVDNNIGGFVNFRNANSVPKSRIESDANGKVTIEPGMNSGTNAAEIVNQRAYDPANTDDIATIGTLDAYTPMVRTTGNQDITGIKTFTSLGFKISQGKSGTSQTREIIRTSSTAADGTYAISFIFGCRYGAGLIQATLVIASGAVSGISTTYVGTNSSQPVKIGAFIDDGSLVVCIRPINNNVNLSASLLGFSYGTGNAVGLSFEKYLTQYTIANITGYVEET